MPSELPPLVRRVVHRLIRAYAPERILLFGSYAKGTTNSRSDVDLLVVAELRGNPVFYQRQARQLAADCFPRVDIVLATPDDVKGAAAAKSPFLLSILGSGVDIYSRATSLSTAVKGDLPLKYQESSPSPNVRPWRNKDAMKPKGSSNDENGIRPCNCG